ncbi:MAG: YveK family protein [Acidimicrobiales bacterium]
MADIQQRDRGPRRLQDDPVARALKALAAPTVLPVVLALVLGAVVAFGGAEYERTRTPVYQSSSVLLLDSPLAITANPATIVSISEVRAKYAGLVGTDVISQPAADTLGVPLRVVARSVTAGLVPNSLDIALKARGSSPARAGDLVAAVSQSLIDYVHAEQAALPVASPQLRLTMRVVGAAYPGYRVSPTHRRELTTGAVLGLIAMAGAYALARALAELRRRTTGG